MRTKAMLWEKLESGHLQCLLCSHLCKIPEERFGFCGVRQNTGGELYTYAYGKVVASNVDPIEKKPLYHFLPGSLAYSIATAGCNFRCGFCQNWSISQLSVKDGALPGDDMLPEDIVDNALEAGCRSISYTYTEPTIFFEYAYDTAKIASERGLYNSFVTNGFMTPEAIAAIEPYLDAANVDLKFFDDDSYKRICKGRLQPVLDSIRNLKKAGVWTEVTTLVVPGENDSDESLGGIANFLAETGEEIPWHISRFHPGYKYTDSVPTPIETMERARQIGIEAGLKYVYLGNVGSKAETFCPGCKTVVIKREGFSAEIDTDVLGNGKCSKCGTTIEGVWGSQTSDIRRQTSDKDD